MSNRKRVSRTKKPQEVQPVAAHGGPGWPVISPSDFEHFVKEWFTNAAHPFDSFHAEHREILKGDDGEYEIDVTIRFTAFGGAQFLVLAECKKHKNAIKRDVVQVLSDRMRSTGAHKGFVFSTSDFQKGAVEYAEKHGLALVNVTDGRMSYIRASGSHETLSAPPGIPAIVGWHVTIGPNGNIWLEVVKDEILRGLINMRANP